MIRAGFREDHLRQIGFEEVHFRSAALADGSGGRMRGVSEDKIDSRARTISTVVRDARRVDLMFEVLRAVVRYAPRLLALRLRHELLEASGTSTWLEYMRESEYALPKLKANKAEKGRQRALTRGLTPSKGVNFSGRLDDTA